MTSLAWHPDSFGTYNLFLDNNEHLWVQARPPYCDRGHWQLGSIGFRYPNGIEPSLYFQHIDTAIEEGELWAARLKGNPITWDCEESIPTDLKHSWDFEKGCFKTQISTSNGSVDVCIQALGNETDPLWKLTIEGIDTLDEADAFPRHYLRLDHATHEAEAFLEWRLNRIPSESPGFIERPSQPVASYVQKALMHSLKAKLSP